MFEMGYQRSWCGRKPVCAAFLAGLLPVQGTWLFAQTAGPASIIRDSAISGNALNMATDFQSDGAVLGGSAAGGDVTPGKIGGVSGIELDGARVHAVRKRIVEGLRIAILDLRFAIGGMRLRKFDVERSTFVWIPAPDHPLTRQHEAKEVPDEP
jgi:hypothetical protein